VLDRGGDERVAEDLIERERVASGTRVLMIRGDAAPVADDRLALFRAAELDGALEWAFLGRSVDGGALLLAVLPDEGDEPVLPPGVAWGRLRSIGGDLPAEEAGILTTAVALAGWLRDAPFCPACGTRTELRHAGWSRHCPHCGREHFPRTDPAVIVLLTSAVDPDRVLLGANAAWGGGRYSCFAGFAEAGESLEEAVAREIFEEAGVRLQDVEYRGSQVWPYPRSLMLGFRARVVDDAEVRADGEEIVEARWFDRDQIGAALRGEDGVQLPGTSSIARRLIDDWYEGAV
jgi:NAD+ diphosphatase